MAWREAAVASWKYDSENCQGLKNTTKHLIQDSRCPDRYSKEAHPEYKSEALPLH
jgi:hypothetical protein